MLTSPVWLVYLLSGLAKTGSVVVRAEVDGWVLDALAFTEVGLPNMLVVKSQRLTLEFRSGVLGPSSSF